MTVACLAGGIFLGSWLAYVSPQLAQKYFVRTSDMKAEQTRLLQTIQDQQRVIIENQEQIRALLEEMKKSQASTKRQPHMTTRSPGAP